jgi:hypothetical protein
MLMRITGKTREMRTGTITRRKTKDMPASMTTRRKTRDMRMTMDTRRYVRSIDRAIEKPTLASFDLTLVGLYTQEHHDDGHEHGHEHAKKDRKCETRKYLVGPCHFCSSPI